MGSNSETKKSAHKERERRRSFWLLPPSISAVEHKCLKRRVREGVKSIYVFPVKVLPASIVDRSFDSNIGRFNAQQLLNARRFLTLLLLSMIMKGLKPPKKGQPEDAIYETRSTLLYSHPSKVVPTITRLVLLL